MIIEDTILEIQEIEVPNSRKEILDSIASYCKKQIAKNDQAQLNFICTHNSRRSQLAQVWAFVFAKYYNLPIQAFSGGIEVTAFYSSGVEVLQSTGLKITNYEGVNPKYTVHYQGDVLNCWSKLYNDKQNPKSSFAAIMTCSHADDNCPLVSGSDLRIPLTYLDPKIADGSAEEIKKYHERSLQIASEMNYLFSKVDT